MSVILDSLARLEGAVGILERNMGGLEGKLNGAQPDMFGGPIVAQKLDQTIEKVERLLEEA